MKRISVLLALSAAAAVLTGCNSSSTPSPAPTLGPACTLPAGVQTALVYPAPGSTVSASSVSRIIIGSTTALDSSRYQIAITDALFPPPNYLIPGQTLQTATPPFPSPNQTPSFANPQYQSSTLNQPFAASQVVSVYINDSKSGDNCTPYGPIGSFTTQ